MMRRRSASSAAGLFSHFSCGSSRYATIRINGVDIPPVEIVGKKIAASFWGKAWCDHMESYHDFENRLPRGRSYVRNGSVVHLEVAKGLVKALVAGSETYSVEIKIDLLPHPDWKAMKSKCAGQISSLLDLLKGKLSDGVMLIVTDRKSGLFPGPDEFRMKCSCPDYAYMCKHIAAALYGIGSRLDSRPESLFLLRGVDHAEFAVDGGVDAVIAKGETEGEQFGGASLSEMFGIELLPSDEISAKSEVQGKGKKRAASKDAKKPQSPKKKSTKPIKTKPASRSKKSAEIASPKPRAGRKTTATTRETVNARLDKVLKVVEKYAESKEKGKPAKGKKSRTTS